MLKTIFLSALLLLSSVLFAADAPPVALVQRVVGTVTLDGKPLKTGDTIDKPGLVVTKEKSMVQFKIEKWGNQISIGPSSQMTLNFSAEKKYTLEEGICRWKSALTEAVKEWDDGSKGKIHTKNVAMGIRGTDFLLKRFGLFNETEIIMFDGSVKMDNIDNPENSIIVRKGQWGGLGGRFGKVLNPPLDLPQSVLNSMIEKVEIQ